MTTSRSLVFRFADIEVREREFCIVKAGEVMAVEPKTFQVLLYMLRKPQMLVSKEELLNAVWRDTSVTENSLPRNIAKLRRLLDDDAREPRYIATVATVGYRLVCEVEVCEDIQGSLGGPSPLHPSGPESTGALTTENGFAAAANSPSELATEQGKQRFRGRWQLSAVGLLTAGLASAVWYLHRPPPLCVTEYTQLTHDSRTKFLAGTDGVRLYLDTYIGPAQMSVSGGEIARIPIALPAPEILGVSPDGSTLIVGSAFGGPGSNLWSVHTLGSSLRRLADGDISSVAWSPDGKSVAYSTLTGDVFVMRSDGTEAHRLASMPTQLGKVLLDRTSWSPDGSRIRFDRDYKIFEILPDGSGLHPMLQRWRPSSMQCCGQWTSDGQFFVFLSWDHPPRNFSLLPPAQMWVLDERRGIFQGSAEPSQLTSGPIRWDWPVPSNDGRKIFARGATLSGELVRFDTKSGQLQPYLGGISAEDVCFSPDGRSIAYVTFPEGILWKANRDGSNPTQLTDPPLYPNRPRWSPDGSQILFFAASRWAEARSYLVSAQGGAPRLLLPDDKESNGNPDWSPDGRKIVFDSEEKTVGLPKHHIRILDLASRQITTLPEEVWNPLWSPNGQFIAAMSGESSSLMVYEFETKRWSVLQKGGTDRPAWSRDSQFIYFLANDPNPGVFRIRLSGAKAERVADLTGVQLTGVWWDGFGLDPTDAPLLLRNIGSDDIYALTLGQKESRW